MPTRFYLHSKKYSDGRHAVYMEVRWGKHAAAKPGDSAAVRLSTGEACKPSEWSDSSQRPVRGAGASAAKKRLNGLDELASDTLEQAVVMGQQVSAAAMKEKLSLYVKYKGEEPPAPEPEPEPEPVATSPTVGQAVEHWKKQMRGHRSPGYIRVMTPLVTFWDDFRPNVTLAELLPDPKTKRSEIVEQWIGYLLEDVPRRGAPGQFGLDNNTVGTYIKRMRTILQFHGLPYDWLKDEFTYEVDVEPLEFSEVMQLAEAPMPRLQLERARDCFVFNCFTGPRYENLVNLQPGDVRQVQGKYLLEYAQYKGRKKTKVKVALDPVALEIWQRYGGKLPVQSNAPMNALIKEAAEIAGLTRPVSVVRQYSTKQVTDRGLLWQFITCHVARHTFATLLLDGEASIVEVQDSLGHSSLQSTRRYAKAREKQRHTSTLTAFDKLRAGKEAA